MIIEELTNDRVRHYSNKGLMIRQIETGALYEDAVDIIPCPYTYEETDTPIDGELTAQEALNIILGVTDDDSNQSASNEPAENN